jgi:hypothetical protein
MAHIKLKITYKIIIFTSNCIKRIQMYIWNNMFFSLGFDVKDHYKEFGGDVAAYTAPVNI